MEAKLAAYGPILQTCRGNKLFRLPIALLSAQRAFLRILKSLKCCAMIVRIVEHLLVKSDRSEAVVF